MTRSPRPHLAWLAAVGVLMTLTIAAVLVLPRVVGSDHSALASAETPASADPPRSSIASASPHVAPRAAPGAATGTLHLVGFGDSVMAGANCGCDDFLTRVGAGLHASTGRKVAIDNDGANGQTAAGLLRELRTDEALPAEIAQADVIVLTIGANDLGPALHSWDDDGCGQGCFQPQIDDMADRLSAILTLVDDDKKSTATVLVTNYWNVFEDGDVGAGDYGKGYLDWSDAVTRAANTAICQAAQRGQAMCVDTYAPFKADGSKDPTWLLSDDGDHPNDAGTAVIARAVLTAAKQHLAG